MKDFAQIAHKIMEKHKKLFEALAKHDTMPLTSRERELVSYIIDNQDTIKADISSSHNPHYKLLPSHLPELYEEQYKERAIGIIKNHLNQFQLSPEENAGLKEFIIKTLGISFLEPPR